jgi:hypothetical protein
MLLECGLSIGVVRGFQADLAGEAVRLRFQRLFAQKPLQLAYLILQIAIFRGRTTSSSTPPPSAHPAPQVAATETVCSEQPVPARSDAGLVGLGDHRQLLSSRPGPSALRT